MSNLKIQEGLGPSALPLPTPMLAPTDWLVSTRRLLFFNREELFQDLEQSGNNRYTSSAHNLTACSHFETEHCKSQHGTTKQHKFH